MENPVIKDATFNPAFKTYIFLIVMFYLIITIIGILIIPFWLCGLGQWLSNKFFHTLKCQLSHKTLKFSKGMVFRIEKTIPLENIQDLSFIGGPVLRSMGLTIIKVETAGGGGAQHSNMMSMPAINDSEEFKEMILRQREIVIKEKNGLLNRPQESNQSENLLAEIRNELVEIKKALVKQRPEVKREENQK